MALQPGETHFTPMKREIHDRDIDFRPKVKHLLKVMTYNIWDRKEYWQERITQVIRIIKENSPDVACLLEVSNDCYNYLLESLEAHYIIFQVFIEEGDTVGMVLLCRRETVDLPEGSEPYYYDFPRIDRGPCPGRVIGVELTLLSNEERVHVLCTKLDDHRDNDHVRSDQFDVVDHVIKKLRNCIVVGDFNIFREGGEDVERKIASSKLDDSWTKMGCPSRVKYTFDGRRNRITQDRTQLRASRIYYSGSHLSIKSLSLVGLNQISQELPIAPSCHYGLVGVFQSGRTDTGI